MYWHTGVMVYWHTDILAYWHTDIEDMQGWCAGHSVFGLGVLWWFWWWLWGWGRRIDARSRCGKERRVSKLLSGAGSSIIISLGNLVDCIGM